MRTRIIIKIVLYLRLSKPKKGKTKGQTITDAYGIEAQRAAGQELASQYGAKIIAEYVEVESGRSQRKRVELQKAISHARLHRATLVIGKLDRLARNNHFISGLLESRVDFVCCDMPEADETTIQMFSVIAERESRNTSARTKAGLAVARNKGVKLGSARPGHWEGRENRRGWKQANLRSAEVRRESAVQAYSFLIGEVRRRRTGGEHLGKIATWLNEAGHTTTRGKPFTECSVHRMLAMFPVSA